MPWKVTQPVSQRIMFIADYVRQEKSVAELCRPCGRWFQSEPIQVKLFINYSN